MQRELVRALPALRTPARPRRDDLAGQLRAGRLTVRTEHYAGATAAWSTSGSTGSWWPPSAAAGALASAVLLVAGGLADARPCATLWVAGLCRADFSLVLLMRTAAQSLHRLPLRRD